MSKFAKQILLAVILVIIWIWMMGYLWHLLPDDWKHQWWGLPLVITSILGGVGVYVMGCWFPFKDKP